MNSSVAKSVHRQVAAYGNRFDPEVAQRMRQMLAPLHSPQDAQSIQISRDHVYGSHERHRLDVFRSPRANTPQPALLFVHGGGFVGGDKRASANEIFYDNVGAWAVRHRLVGITMNYRLAPAFQWPSGLEDVAAAVAWVTAHAQELNVDAERIVLMGHSAGAAHVGAYLAAEALAHRTPVRAAVLLSGLFDIAAAADNPSKSAYYGHDLQLREQQSSILGLTRSKTPLLVAFSELDPPDFQRQGLLLLQALVEARGSLPYTVQMKHENHVSALFRLGLPDDPLGAELERFIERHIFQ